MTAWRLVLLFGLGLPSCATTSGREWLEAPIEPRVPSARSEDAFTVTDESVEARPRLRQTVTLGESYAPAPPAVAAVGGPSVQVNVNNTQIVNHPIGYGYGGYGYGYGYAAGYGSARGYGASVVGAPVRATPTLPTKVGGDFPPPPDYGPRALR